MTGRDKRYTYAAGRIRVLETRLLNRHALERLVETETLNEAVFILKEYGLNHEMDENLMAGYKVLNELSRDREVTNSFRIKYDFHNLKAILKARAMNIKEEGLSRLGLLGIETIKRMTNKERIKAIPFDYLSLLRKIEPSASAEGLSLQASRFAIDKFMISYILGLFSRHDFLREYFRRCIDLKNLGFYFRLSGKNDILKEALLDGGYIAKRQFLRGLDIRELNRYDALMNPWTEASAKEKDLSLFEKLCDDYLLNFLKPAKYLPFGIEPLFGYVTAVEYQARAVNAILFSKKNEIPKDEIRRYLRETYA